MGITRSFPDLPSPAIPTTHNAMAVYEIAGIPFQIEPQGSVLRSFLAPYASETSTSAIPIPSFSEETEVTETLRQLSLRLLYDFEGIFLHGAVVLYAGKAWLFTAPPGTGKSTHVQLWQQKLGSRVKILNGDKPLLRLSGDGITVYGSPWRGKEQLGFNGSAPLGGIYILRRSAENTVSGIDRIQALAELLSATVYPADETGTDKLLIFLQKLTDRIPVRLLHCRPDTGAVDAVLEDIL